MSMVQDSKHRRENYYLGLWIHGFCGILQVVFMQQMSRMLPAPCCLTYIRCNGMKNCSKFLIYRAVCFPKSVLPVKFMEKRLAKYWRQKFLLPESPVISRLL